MDILLSALSPLFLDDQRLVLEHSRRSKNTVLFKLT